MQKNSVEEYVYNMREKIYGDYEKYISESDREQYASILSKTEDWLYEEGEDETKSVYLDKLAELKTTGQPVVDRFFSHLKIPSSLEELGATILHFRKVLELYDQKDEKYEHIEASEMKKVEKRIEDKFKWYNEKAQEYSKCEIHVTPAIQPSEILNEKKMIENFCNPIVNKPKPKAEPPKEEANKDAESAPATDAGIDAGSAQMDTDQKDVPKKELDMEVD